MSQSKHGKVVILSGPSGAGKTTIVKRLLQACALPLVLRVSATTRPARPGEEDAVDYHFLTEEEFSRLREDGEFLEAFEVYGRGYWYGTLKREVSSSLAAGKWVVLEIDVQGMQRVVQQYPDAVSFFIRPASLEELERRLRGRGTEAEETIQRRLQVARQEWQYKDRFRHDIVNDSLDDTVHTICQRLMAEAGC